MSSSRISKHSLPSRCRAPIAGRAPTKQSQKVTVAAAAVAAATHSIGKSECRRSHSTATSSAVKTRSRSTAGVSFVGVSSNKTSKSNLNPSDSQSVPVPVPVPGSACLNSVKRDTCTIVPIQLLEPPIVAKVAMLRCDMPCVTFAPINIGVPNPVGVTSFCITNDGDDETACEIALPPRQLEASDTTFALAPGASKRITLRYKGGRKLTSVIRVESLHGETLYIPVHATVDNPNLTLPEQIDFGIGWYDMTHQQTFIVKNTSTLEAFASLTVPTDSGLVLEPTELRMSAESEQKVTVTLRRNTSGPVDCHISLSVVGSDAPQQTHVRGCIYPQQLLVSASRYMAQQQHDGLLKYESHIASPDGHIALKARAYSYHALKLYFRNLTALPTSFGLVSAKYPCNGVSLQQFVNPTLDSKRSEIDFAPTVRSGEMNKRNARKNRNQVDFCGILTNRREAFEAYHSVHGRAAMMKRLHRDYVTSTLTPEEPIGIFVNRPFVNLRPHRASSVRVCIAAQSPGVYYDELQVIFTDSETGLSKCIGSVKLAITILDEIEETALNKPSTEDRCEEYIQLSIITRPHCVTTDSDNDNAHTQAIQAKNKKPKNKKRKNKQNDDIVWLEIHAHHSLQNQ
jgi:hypothetical protein